MINPGAGFLRNRHGDTHSRVTFVELFFDLVFVFAVTQLSHALLEHLTLGGLVETTLLLMAVWWVWVYTSWVTNWLDPDRTLVRLELVINLKTPRRAARMTTLGRRAAWLVFANRRSPQGPDVVAGPVGFELRNVVTNYPVERSIDFREST